MMKVYKGLQSQLWEQTLQWRQQKEHFVRGKSSGTSLAAPVIAGLITLMDESYKKQGHNYSGVDLLKILDATCLLPDPELRKYYGNGIIDPLKPRA